MELQDRTSVQRSTSPLDTSVSSFWISRSKEEIAPQVRMEGWRPTMTEIYGTSRAQRKTMYACGSVNCYMV